jgi:hypothetical protein
VVKIAEENEKHGSNIAAEVCVTEVKLKLVMALVCSGK